HAPLADLGVVAAGQALDHLVGADRAGGRHDLGAAGVGAAEADVVGDRAGEQESLLRHVAEAGAQVGQAQPVEREAVEQDPAAGGGSAAVGRPASTAPIRSAPAVAACTVSYSSESCCTGSNRLRR